MVKIKIRLGDFEDEYTAFMTNSPRVYDGFSTFTLHEIPNPDKFELPRLILIAERDIEWQRGRYGSGLHTMKECEDYMGKSIQEMLFKRLMGQEEDE